MGGAAPSGIVTLVLIESALGPVPDHLIESRGGLPLVSQALNEFPAVFDRATDGLRFALLVVRERREAVRVAVVTYEMDLDDSPSDQWAFQRARTILKGAFEGMILVASGTREVLGLAPVDYGLMMLGKFNLPDLERPETLYRLTHRSIPSNFPRATRFSVAPSNLPSPGGAYIHRELEEEKLRDLTSLSRKIVLLGPAGIGKTRLAIDYGQQCMEEDFDGVWYIDLRSAINVQERIGTYTADKIGAIADPTMSPVERIAARLKNQTTLLIFEGCEVAAHAVSKLIPLLTAECPNLMVILTSQIPLTIEKQAVYEMPPMSSDDAISLFVDRVCTSHPEFDPSTKVLKEIASLCDELHNLPMAIELVGPLYLVSKGKVRIEQSQRSIVTRTLDWITSHLTRTENQLALACSVFRGPVQAEGASQVARVGTPADLEALARKALLIPEGSGSFRVPNAVREYFAETQANRVNEFEIAHARFFLDRAQHVGKEFSESSDTALFGDDIDNFHQALDSHCLRASQEGAFDLAFVLFDYWYRAGLYKEGIYWLKRTAEVTEDRFKQARIMNLAASMALGGADFVTGSDYANEGIVIAQKLKSDILLSRLYSNSGLLLYGQQNYDAALVALREAKKCARRTGEKTVVPDLYTAVILAEMGEFAKAEKLFKAIKLDQLPMEMNHYLDLRWGIMRNFEGRWTDAQKLLEASLIQSNRIQDMGCICGAMRSLVITYANLGYDSQSAIMAGAAEALSEKSFNFWPKKQRELYDETLKALTARVGQSYFEELRTEGFDTSATRIVNTIEWNGLSFPG